MIRIRRLLAPWPTVVLLAALLGAWELYVDLGGISPLVLPAPHAVAVALADDRGLLWSNFLITAREVVLGVLLATAAALVLATVMHLSATVRRAVYPVLIASQTIPIPIIAPLLVLWLGFGILPKLVIVGLVSFFSIVIPTLAGLAAVDRDLIKLMTTFGSTRRRTFVHVEMPAALPGLFTGLKLGVVIAVLGAVFAEESGANSGLGYVFLQSIPQLLTARAFAALVVLSGFAIGLFALLSLAERVTVPWARAATRENQSR